MITVFLATLLLLGGVMAVLALGLFLSGRSLRGSCGGAGGECACKRPEGGCGRAGGDRRG